MAEVRLIDAIAMATDDDRFECDEPYCPNCGKWNESIYLNYCPNCGAKMEDRHG